MNATQSGSYASASIEAQLPPAETRNSESRADTVHSATTEQVCKPVYTINDLVNLHGFSRRTVIRLYEDEPGVQVIERPEVLFGGRGKRGKRRYRSFRVPHAVYVRMKARLEVRKTIQ